MEDGLPLLSEKPLPNLLAQVRNICKIKTDPFLASFFGAGSIVRATVQRELPTFVASFLPAIVLLVWGKLHRPLTSLVLCT